MRRFTLVFSVLALLVAVGSAGDEPQPVLEKGDVDHFIKSYPLLAAELENLGMKYDAAEGEYSLPEALRANAEFRALLNKHGWDEQFFIKMQAIFMGYISLVHKKEMEAAAPQMEKAIKEIENTQGMSEAMKKQMIERMKAARQMMQGGESGMRMSVHEDDLALIRPKIPDLKKLFEDQD